MQRYCIDTILHCHKSLRHPTYDDALLETQLTGQIKMLLAAKDEIAQ